MMKTQKKRKNLNIRLFGANTGQIRGIKSNYRANTLNYGACLEKNPDKSKNMENTSNYGANTSNYGANTSNYGANLM